MRTPRGRAAALGLLLALLATACRQAPEVPSATLGPSPSPSPSPSVSPTPTSQPSSSAEASPPAGSGSPTPTAATSPDPYAVPDEIDAAYAQTVLDALDEALTPGIQASADQDELAPELEERMEALWTDDWIEEVQPLFREEFEESADRIADDVETRYHAVEEVVVAESDCIVVRATIEFTPWLSDEVEAPAPGRYVTALVPREDEPTPDATNPTPWLINYDQESDSDVERDQLCDD